MATAALTVDDGLSDWHLRWASPNCWKGWTPAASQRIAPAAWRKAHAGSGSPAPSGGSSSGGNAGGGTSGGNAGGGTSGGNTGTGSSSGGTSGPAKTPGPTNLATGAVTASSVALTWDAVVGATGYKVETSTDHTTWTPVTKGNGGEVTATGTTVAGLTAATAYDFRVTATLPSGDSQPSSSVTATTS